MTKLIQVFEHQNLRVGQQGFTAEMRKALELHYGEGKPYYSLIHNGVRFNQYVGVIQVDGVTIEVLPKIDKLQQSQDKGFWQKKLIDMLLVVSHFDAKISSTANLAIKSNAILDAYFSLFINEVENLLHKGLIKQYHKQQANLATLKGKLNFSQHIRKNTVHQERFFVEYTVYDQHNIYNQILYKTIQLINKLNHCPALASRINRLLFNFPKMADLHVDSATFERIVINRKNHHYQAALSIAELILLNYHPDITCGKRAVLALMFDMNILWEKFVVSSLQRGKHSANFVVKQQSSKPFWQSQHLRADIVISYCDHSFVLDTKWKCLDYHKPSSEDLRQLYTYHHYYQADKVALVYPSCSFKDEITGRYKKVTDNEKDKTCSLLFLDLLAKNIDIQIWQRTIREKILKWIGFIEPANSINDNK
ncbi:hypothetical protein RHO13_12330 [Orbus wheelerorum]|uniref:McrC family protein n=1 Tax=Orbus wheelerorum TaxID=3074111 RepID=UPI00370D3B2A